MRICKAIYTKYLYVELYRMKGEFITGLRISLEPWMFCFNIYILGLSLIINIGKDWED